MIIKSFNLSDIKKTENKIFLLFGENEGQKDDVVKKEVGKNEKILINQLKQKEKSSRAMASGAKLSQAAPSCPEMVERKKRAS